MLRTVICEDCKTEFAAAVTGVLPTRCQPCKKAWKTNRQRSVQDRRNELQRQRRKVAAECRQTLPKPLLTCETCGVSFERKSRKGPPAKRCYLCNCFTIAVGQARRHQKIADGGNFQSVEVFVRDGYRCYLCGGQCTGAYPDPMSPSLDHVSPISKGGAHVLQNVKTAHLLCNMSKSVNEPGFSRSR